MDPDRSLSIEGLIPALVSALPELQPAYQQLLEEWSPDTPGPHVTADDLLVELIRDAELKADLLLLERALTFLEVMSSSKDVAVQNVAAVSVLEVLGDDRLFVARVEPLLGPQTKVLLRMMDRFWGRQ